MSALDKMEAHVDRVYELLHDVAKKFEYRGDVHDASKFSEIEMTALEELEAYQVIHGAAKFGTPEYDAQKVILKPMLEHHYAHNSHHPEHYPNGVAGMDLFDLVEMFFDWKAASERSNDSSMNLEAAMAKYNIAGILADILRNTARNMGYIP